MENLVLPARAAAVLAEVDDAMWLRAREGDVAAAKLVYARLAQVLPPAPPALPPTWVELEALIMTVQQQQKELSDELLDDAAGLGVGPPR